MMEIMTMTMVLLSVVIINTAMKPTSLHVSEQPVIFHKQLTSDHPFLIY